MRPSLYNPLNFSFSQFRNVDIYTGQPNFYTVDSLSSFWPGLQVLAGDVENAIKSHLMCKTQKLLGIHLAYQLQDWNIWKKFSGLPEVWDTRFMVRNSLSQKPTPDLFGF